MILPPLWLKMALWKATEKETNQACTHTHTHTNPLTANHEHERKREERSAKEETMDTKRTNKAANKGGREAPPAEARAAENCPPSPAPKESKLLVT
jgi:hypothetical protein